MNPLESYIAANRLNEFQVLNEIDDAGLISNHCLRAMDVARVDCERAVKWLKEKHALAKPQTPQLPLQPR